MILVLHVQIGERLPRRIWERMLEKMPGPVRTGIGRYRRWEDRQAVLFGKLLLAEGLKRMAYPAHLKDLVWDVSGRPFLGGGMDFNISHSGEYVVCALCREGRVGIDIEKIRPIDVTDFQGQMTPRQWEAIVASECPEDTFFRLWTQKEAVIKADGGGMAIPLDIIVMEGGKAFLDDAVWTVKEVRIADGYRCFLATNSDDPEMRSERIPRPQGLIAGVP
jgi:4'-phosphopantetheinyl transferase